VNVHEGYNAARQLMVAVDHAKHVDCWWMRRVSASANSSSYDARSGEQNRPRLLRRRKASTRLRSVAVTKPLHAKDTGEGKMRHSAAGRETGSTASAKHSGHSVGKTTRCCPY